MDEEPESLEDRFQLAAERMRQNTALSLSNEQKLQLYGYFKQVAVNNIDCTKLNSHILSV